MRVLFTSLASVGHTYPLVPLAVAARDAGHEVHWAVGENVHAPLEKLGLRPFRPGFAFYEIYAEDLEPELERLRPDLVVHEWGLVDAAKATRKAGIAGLWHGFGRMFPDGIGLDRPQGGTHVDICPPSLQNEDFTDERILLRPVPFNEPGELPDTRRPLIYLTLGTAFGTAELLNTAIDGLAPLGDVVVAAGRVGVAEIKDVANVRVRPWVPQAEILKRADLVVHHAGSGTMLGALAAGIPQVLLPRGADQFANADAVVKAGAGLRLDAPTADEITEAARNIENHRDAARAIADEIARMPSPDDVARRLPDLV